ncbi:kinase-like protein [Mollisia scopiformis]|uniref:non-specific serine/threonine protein kinase n=1 Tax=Mollisia scopiformis TaxID=149040 RepID=A0A194XT03_MOLSC|nr:kinase-like protein [Mollisia scopiformis]KUJ23328.1 kinase-like protein [Mollisia scopiformis]
MSSDLDNWHINATVYDDRVEELHFISDPAKRVRRKPHTKVWQVERLLGRGSFGEVRLEKNRGDGTARAVKKVHTESSTLSKKECEQELKALLEFSKPKSKEAACFVEFFGWFQHGFDIYLAMEYVELGDLEQNIKARSGRLPENEVRSITEQILSGLAIMHAQSFAHRDLKPQNILVVVGPPDWWIKLADFGLSKRLIDASVYRTAVGTQSYIAPEILRYLDSVSGYTNAVDLWSVGCIVYRLISGIVPFPPGADLFRYCQNKALFPGVSLVNSGISASGLLFVQQVLITEPAERLTVSQALQHPWISADPKVTAVSLDASNLSIEYSERDPSHVAFPNNRYSPVSYAGLQSFQSSVSAQTILPRVTKSSPSRPSSSTVRPSTLASFSSPDIVREDGFANSRVSFGENPEGKRFMDRWKRQRPKSTGHKLPKSKDLKLRRTAESSTPRTIAKDIAPAGSGEDNLWNKLGGVFVRKADTVFSTAASTPGTDTKGSYDLPPRRKVAIDFKGFCGPIRALAFSLDGSSMTVVSDEGYELWNVAEGKLWKAHKDSAFNIPGCRSVKLSPHGNLFACAVKGEMAARIWEINAEPMRDYSTLKLQDNYKVQDITFSPDSTLIAIASEYIDLYNTKTNNFNRTFASNCEGSINHICFSPNGKFIAGISDGWKHEFSNNKIRYWDIADQALHQIDYHYRTPITCLAFSPDSRLIAAASMPGSIRLWDFATGQMTLALSCNDRFSKISSLTFSPNGQQLIAVDEGRLSGKAVRLWGFVTGDTYDLDRGHSSWINDVVFSPNSKLIATASSDKIVGLWDAATGQIWKDFKDNTGTVTCVAFSPDSKILASGSLDETVRLWDI